MSVDFKFLQNQFETYVVTACVIAVVVFATTRLAESEYAIVTIQSLLSVAFICLARLVSKKSSVVSSNIAWLIAGIVIVGFSVYTMIALEPLKEVEGVNFILHMATLIWAPLGAGLVVGPLMYIRPTST